MNLMKTLLTMFILHRLQEKSYNSQPFWIEGNCRERPSGDCAVIRLELYDRPGQTQSCFFCSSSLVALIFSQRHDSPRGWAEAILMYDIVSFRWQQVETVTHSISGLGRSPPGQTESGTGHFIEDQPNRKFLRKTVSKYVGDENETHKGDELVCVSRWRSL